MEETIINLLGWMGAAVYLGAYALVSTKRLAGDAYTFQGMNVLGGVLLTINSAYFRVWPSVAVNVVWVGIAVAIMVRRGLRERSGGR